MSRAAGRSGEPPRAWQRMLSGRRLDLLDPSPLDVEIDDIAHGLARVARWNGQTRGDHAFSVAQHSLLVEEIFGRIAPAAGDRDRLAALLHDAAEYVIGDMISPFKAVVGGAYRAVEERLAAAINLSFGLPPVLPKTLEAKVKRADRTAAYFESVELAGFSDREARRYFGAPAGFEAAALAPWLTPLPTPAVEAAFLQRFAVLCAESAAGPPVRLAGASEGA